MPLECNRLQLCAVGVTVVATEQQISGGQSDPDVSLGTANIAAVFRGEGDLSFVFYNCVFFHESI